MAFQTFSSTFYDGYLLHMLYLRKSSSLVENCLGDLGYWQILNNTIGINFKSMLSCWQVSSGYSNFGLDLQI